MTWGVKLGGELIETSSCPGVFLKSRGLLKGKGLQQLWVQLWRIPPEFHQPRGQAQYFCCGQVLHRSQLECSRENIAAGWDRDCPSQDLQIKQQLLLVRLTQTRKGYLRKRDVSQEAKLTEVTTSHVGPPFPISSPHQDWTRRARKRSGSSPDQQGESQVHNPSCLSCARTPRTEVPSGSFTALLWSIC